MRNKYDLKRQDNDKDFLPASHRYYMLLGVAEGRIFVQINVIGMNIFNLTSDEIIR